MRSFSFFILILLVSFAFSLDFYDVSVSFQGDVIAGVENRGYLSVLRISGFPYDGSVDLESRDGAVSKRVLIDSGFGEFVFKPAQDVRIGIIEVKVEDEIHRIETLVLPKETLEMEDWYLVVKEFGGNVGIKRKGSEIVEAVRAGTKLFPGDSLFTSKDSYAILEGPGNTKFSVTPQSAIYVKMVKKGKNDFIVKIKVQAGDVLTETLKKLSIRSTIIMESKGVTAGVRGTIFSFESGENVKVRTFRGKVLVLAMGKSVDVDEGMMAVIPSKTLEIIKEKMDWFDSMAKKALERFEFRAREALKPFGLENFLTPIDKSLYSYKEMFEHLREINKNH